MAVEKLTEKQIERSILQYLHSRKIFCWKVNTVGVFDAKKGVYRRAHSPFILSGISDILGIISSGPNKGKMLSIEVKVPSRRNNLTEHQKHFLSLINLFGGIAFVATSIKEVEENLLKLEIV